MGSRDAFEYNVLITQDKAMLDGMHLAEAAVQDGGRHHRRAARFKAMSDRMSTLHLCVSTRLEICGLP